VDTVLLDTTVASLLHPKKNSTLRALYEPDMKGKTLALSFQSVGELWSWAEERKWGERERNGLDQFLRRFLIIPYDYELAKVWAKVRAHSRCAGGNIAAGDAWIAATAIHRQLCLLSHDRHHAELAIAGLKVITYLDKSTVDDEKQPPADRN
jgi:tRNA(fMet)-specific endonuclease VapC